MKPIVTTELYDVRYAFGSSESAKSRYNQIKGTFDTGKEYKIFAEPVVTDGGNKITWLTEYDGSIVSISKLSPEDQSNARNLLRVEIQKLLTAAKTYEDTELMEFLYKCIEVPTVENIYLVNANGTQNVVLTQWGFLSDVPGADKGILDKIINAIRVPMPFRVVYIDDESPAPFAEVHFEFEGKKEILKSDADGKLILDDVKVDTFVKAYEIENDEQLNLQTYTCYEHGEYVVKVTKKVDMRFRVINSKNEPMPNELFFFKFNEQEEQLTTDANGMMLLPKIKLDTEVSVFQTIEGKEENVNHFICENDKKEYLIVIQLEEEPVIPPPPVHNMKFKIVDKKSGEIVPNAKVILKYNGKKEEFFSDEFGFVVLENVEPNTKVKVVATGKSQKKKKESTKK